MWHAGWLYGRGDFKWAGSVCCELVWISLGCDCSRLSIFSKLLRFVFLLSYLCLVVTVLRCTLSVMFRCMRELLRIALVSATYRRVYVQSAPIPYDEVLKHVALQLYSVLVHAIAVPAGDVLPPVAGSGMSQDKLHWKLADYSCVVVVWFVFTHRLLHVCRLVRLVSSIFVMRTTRSKRVSPSAVILCCALTQPQPGPTSALVGFRSLEAGGSRDGTELNGFLPVDRCTCAS